MGCLPTCSPLVEERGSHSNKRSTQRPLSFSTNQHKMPHHALWTVQLRKVLMGATLLAMSWYRIVTTHAQRNPNNNNTVSIRALTTPLAWKRHVNARLRSPQSGTRTRWKAGRSEIPRHAWLFFCLLCNYCNPTSKETANNPTMVVGA